MRRRTTTPLVPVGFALIAVLFGILGARGAHTPASGDVVPSRSVAVVSTAIAQPSPVIAERLPDPLRSEPLVSFGLAAMTLAVLAVLHHSLCASDRRAIAAVTGLRCRHRGPPRSFTS
jgi:hypothetical protein